MCLCISWHWIPSATLVGGLWESFFQFWEIERKRWDPDWWSGLPQTTPEVSNKASQNRGSDPQTRPFPAIQPQLTPLSKKTLIMRSWGLPEWRWVRCRPRCSYSLGMERGLRPPSLPHHQAPGREPGLPNHPLSAAPLSITHRSPRKRLEPWVPGRLQACIMRIFINTTVCVWAAMWKLAI